MKMVSMVLTAVLLASPLGRAATHEIYPTPEQSRLEVQAALKKAAAEHKRVILDFGGNWCGDCQALDIYIHDGANLPLLEKYFVLAHVNIGHMDANLDIAERYEVPLNKGVPALAVLDEHGQLLYSQKGGEFEAMRRMRTEDVTEFLNKWKATRR